MNKTSTYYFVLFALLNLGLGFLFMPFNQLMCEQLASFLGNKALPALTRLLVSYPWWPFIFAGFFLSGLIISISTQIKSKTLYHVIIIGLTIECFILFLTTVGYAMPFVSITSELS